jgi:DNA modification methylase
LVRFQPFHKNNNLGGNVNERFNLFEGNCLEVMKTMDADSIDSIVTDPPYELGFMGKSWDSSGIAFNVEVWQEALRVLKPGGHLIAFSGSRTYHRMAMAIEDAGFEIRDQIMWVYGSGFPKSHDVSKAIDKNNGETGRLLKFTNWMRTTGLKAKQLDEATGTNMGGHYLTTASQPAIPTVELWQKIRPLVADVPEWVDELVDRIEAEREVVGTKMGLKSIDGNGHGIVPGGINVAIELDITAPATAAAKQWQGWGTALKPAHEPMVLARKPLIGTVANNVLTYGVGGLNIDGSRVEGEVPSVPQWLRSDSNAPFDASGRNGEMSQPHSSGRFPANFIHDGSDEVVALFPDTNKGTARVGKPGGSTFGGTAMSDEVIGTWYGDSGSAARFFYCAKASKKDRNEGLDGFEAKRDHDGRADGGVGGDNPRNRTNNAKLNHHPTVKPTSLMQYLVRLVTPPNGIVLDPFLGSGSTGKAAMYEGFNFVGIELTPEYLPIAKARILFALKDKEGELDFEPR